MYLEGGAGDLAGTLKEALGLGWKESGERRSLACLANTSAPSESLPCSPHNQAVFHTYQTLFLASLSERMDKILSASFFPSPTKPQIYFKKHHTRALSRFLVPYSSCWPGMYIFSTILTHNTHTRTQTCTHKHTHTIVGRTINESSLPWSRETRTAEREQDRVQRSWF